MKMTPSYWATNDDEHFEAGHYVEAWELDRLAGLSAAVVELLRREAEGGNKIRVIAEGYVELAKPIGPRVWSLPEGLVFWCPLQEQPISHYDGDEDGVVACLQSDTRVFPTGLESGPDLGTHGPRASAA